ncbi:heterokaryon incompatibility protein-domain-containing protein [Coniella lustricola]|uniref:Heterokaryon incompatibility protein-domain-containing protein n=1 Tax=Coniella lustricola TaxID=2025994 RepID=A0A2T2ZU11_9PEZI|nr:heterokaryon incompatibility protein-domain-containing protein [Coniella lustricola]
MRGSTAPLLSIGHDYTMWEDGNAAAQPQSLSAADQPLSIIKYWIQHCDERHGRSSCTAGGPQSSRSESQQGRRLPGRFIAVGVAGDEMVYLQATDARYSYKWVALSHQWGREGVHQQFCTTKQNIRRHVNGMRVDDLADTYRDAVKVTRDLGCAYLWIDSVCIVQGAGGDFDTQAKLMEQVYSGAYVVLAACRAPGHYGGFLQPRQEKAQVLLDKQGSTQRVCLVEVVDDFQQHVLGSQLYQRAWVLQEHALARRTIYFTDHQVYFECGSGVRCESMTKMTKRVLSGLVKSCETLCCDC